MVNWSMASRFSTSRLGRRLRAFGVAAALSLMSANPLAAQTLFEDDPIFALARNGDVGAVDYLFKKGTAVDTADPSGMTVLSIGAVTGNLAMVELALENGARVDREDKIGRTALFWAVESGNPEVVGTLLKAGADINHQTRDGLTPVMAAVRSNKLAALHRLLQKSPDLTMLDYTGRSALGWAEINRDKRAAGMLRRAGATD